MILGALPALISSGQAEKEGILTREERVAYDRYIASVNEEFNRKVGDVPFFAKQPQLDVGSLLTPEEFKAQRDGEKSPPPSSVGTREPSRSSRARSPEKASVRSKKSRPPSGKRSTILTRGIGASDSSVFHKTILGA